MLFDKKFGVDLGTSAVKIYHQKKNHFTTEKNMIAVRENTDVFAVGDEAFEMYERTPENIEVITPMLNGRVSDVSLVEAVLHTLLSRTDPHMGQRPVLFFSIPMDLTEIEKRAYYSIAHRGKLKRCRVFLVEKPIVDALALGVPINRTKGSMIVNIGAQSTELSVIADSRVIISKMIPLGGISFTAAVAAGVRRKNNMQISMKTAESLKQTLTDLPDLKPATQRTFGVDGVTGLPRDGMVTSYTVTGVVREQLQEIAAEILRFIERTPPQVRTSILAEGIYLAGGCTRLPGLDLFFREFLDCPVLVSRYYELCTIHGLKELIDHPTLQHWAFTPKKRKY